MSKSFAHCHLLGAPTRGTHVPVWEVGQVTCWRSETRRRLNKAESQICLRAILPTHSKCMQITIIWWAEQLTWGEVEGIPLAPPGLIFPVAYNATKGMHLSVWGSASNVLLFYPQIAPLLTANSFMVSHPESNMQSAFINKLMLSFWQYLPKPKLYIPFDLTIFFLGSIIQKFLHMCTKILYKMFTTFILIVKKMEMEIN